MSNSIAILPKYQDDRDLARIWASRLSLPVLEAGEPGPLSSPTLVLWVHDGDASLCMTGTKAPGPLVVDFGSVKLNRRVRQGLSQSLARACGLRDGKRPAILDVTAGLGRDAYVLAALGSNVTLVEHNPILHLMLERALDGVDLPMDLHLADACELMEQRKIPTPDVIYMDPMFPPRKKSAQVKKDMQLLHALLGEPATIDSESLLWLALGWARQRVVVKRPRISPPLGGKKPHQSFVGRSHRYDLYVVADGRQEV